MQYKFVILFYLIIIFIIVRFRHKFEFQAKFIALYRTKIGLKLMDKIGTKHARFIRGLAHVGIVIGYLGMALIMVFIVKGVYDLLLVPDAPAVISPVIPGVPIPGSPIFVPFWYGIISLFIVVVIHEFCHGIVARAHNLPVKNTGVVFFGPLVGAFVEPDEKKLKKAKDVVKCSVFAAGPFSNIITAVIIILLMVFVFSPMIDKYVQPIGISFTGLESGMPAEQSGLETGVIYNQVNNQTIENVEDFILAFDEVGVNETIYIGNEQNTYLIVTTSRPENPEWPVIGVFLKTRYTNEDNAIIKVFLWLIGLIWWVYVLSLGLGLANLLPLGPVDGGRMIHVSLVRTFGEKKGTIIWTKITIFLIIILGFLLFIPILKAIF